MGAGADTLKEWRRVRAFGARLPEPPEWCQNGASHAVQLRTPDALQIACALETDCQALLTNDDRLRRVKEMRVVVLDALLAGATALR